MIALDIMGKFQVISWHQQILRFKSLQIPGYPFNKLMDANPFSTFSKGPIMEAIPDMDSGQPKLYTENLMNIYGDENQVKSTPSSLGGTPGQCWPTDTTPFKSLNYRNPLIILNPLCIGVLDTG